MKNRSSRRGFTLIELLVVITIISILTAVVALNIFGESGRARVTQTKANVKMLKQAIEMYNNDNGMIPSQAQGLSALVARPSGDPAPANYKKGGYLSVTKVPKDGWGHDFVYIVPGRTGDQPYEIVSYGSDGEPGGKDEAADISSAE